MKRWEDKDWIRSMRITFDFNGMMAENIGHLHGISEVEIYEMEDLFAKVHQDLKKRRKAGELPFYELPYDQKMLDTVIKKANEIKRGFENFVVLGIGGSAQGGIALCQALTPPYYNLLPDKKRKGLPRIFFADNIDPETFGSLIELIDMEKTVFNVISKSGGTAETMSQFLIIRDRLIRRLGRKNHTDHIIATTDPEKGNLRAIAQKEGYYTFSIPPGVGGRFSVFTPVGLLPAAVVGVDIAELMAGARYADKACRTSSLWNNPAAMGAVLQVLAYMKKWKQISVMMPYADGLSGFGGWYRQLWAESLGKKYDLEGRTVNIGQTPVSAMGVTDQHSQLQLYMEGPYDKVITLISIEKYGKTLRIPSGFKDMEGIGYLGGHTLNELIQAEEKATEFSLLQNSRSHAVLRVPEINPFTVGQLLFMLEVQTIYAGGLLNINPLDQPGVETGKHFTYGMMGRKGYEDNVQLSARAQVRNKKYQITI